MVQRLVLASGNAGKLKELQALLAPLAIEVVAQSELGVVEAEETGLSFIENALLKARNAAAQTGLPALADDSGLAVDALGGAPGIYSARYSGGTDADNNAKLLRELATENNRQAKFICALALVRHKGDPVPLLSIGQWPGQILEQAQGEQGFGYDPVFQPEAMSCSAADLSREQKSAVSHRGRALAQMLELLQAQPLEADC